MAAPTPSKAELKSKAPVEVAQRAETAPRNTHPSQAISTSIPPLPSSQPPSIETDISRLTSLLANANISDEHADKDLEELLEGLETADGLARGVEDRLDGLLENLEALLVGLEGERAEGKVEDGEAVNGEKKERG